MTTYLPSVEKRRIFRERINWASKISGLVRNDYKNVTFKSADALVTEL